MKKSRQVLLLGGGSKNCGRHKKKPTFETVCELSIFPGEEQDSFFFSSPTTHRWIKILYNPDNKMPGEVEVTAQRNC